MSKGIIASVTASTMFAVMYLYSSFLTPLDGQEIFGWRTLLTLPCLTLYIWATKDWPKITEHLARIRRTPLLLVGMLGTAFLMGVQLWMFLWAPVNGRSMQVSMGYFLLPLAMVLAGRLVYGERLSHLQKIAVAFAALGVGHEVYQNGSFAWETLVVVIGYPMFFILRRFCRTDHLGGLWCDMCLMLPVALYFVIQSPLTMQDLHEHAALWILIPVLGAISALSLIAYLVASRTLPFSLFGLLSYVEPVLLIGVSLLLGETIGPDQWLTYVPIWAAVVVLIIEGFKHLTRQRRRSV
ncbi:EamA family transporter RarD [Pseudomonas putida]